MATEMEMEMEMEIIVAGENTLIVYVGREISEQTSTRVLQLTKVLDQQFRSQIIDLIPSYHSVVVVYDNRQISFKQLKAQILAIDSNTAVSGPGKELRLPVYYSEETGPDLTRIARHHQLSIEQVIETHQHCEYRVYAIGFAPGFAYLGKVAPSIATPRLQTPRARVPAGSVAIADQQTAVYPAESPGGWNLIGRCPLPMFDRNESPPTPFCVGDRVRFFSISRTEFLDLGGSL